MFDGVTLKVERCPFIPAKKTKTWPCFLLLIHCHEYYVIETVIEKGKAKKYNAPSPSTVPTLFEELAFLVCLFRKFVFNPYKTISEWPAKFVLGTLHIFTCSFS